MQPKRFKFGMSGGFGGLHEWGKPSFDVHWHNTTLRVAPGLFYMSAGITQKIAYFMPKHRFDRTIIISLYYHKDYFLTDILRKKQTPIKNDLNIFMVMPGIHVDLNLYGDVYFEASVGMMYAYERTFPVGKENVLHQHHFWPMGEIRCGGIFLSRKEHHQHFPPVDPKNYKIKKKKLKFKSKE